MLRSAVGLVFVQEEILDGNEIGSCKKLARCGLIESRVDRSTCLVEIVSPIN